MIFLTKFGSYFANLLKYDCTKFCQALFSFVVHRLGGYFNFFSGHSVAVLLGQKDNMDQFIQFAAE